MTTRTRTRTRTASGLILLAVGSFAGLAFTMSASAASPTYTQVVTLQGGWNAIYLEVDPDPADIATVFGSLEGVLESVWKWSPSMGRVDFIDDPADGLIARDGWRGYFPASGGTPLLTNLFSVRGNQAYLVHLVGPPPPEGPVYELAITGTPSLRPTEWVPDSFNLVGFPIDPAAPSPPTVADYFQHSPAHKDQLVYSLGPGGVWEDAVRLESGRSYWVYTEGASDYQGPIEVRAPSRDGLVFGAIIDDLDLTILDKTGTGPSLKVTQLPSADGASPPDLGHWQLDGDEEIWPDLPSPYEGEFLDGLGDHIEVHNIPLTVRRSGDVAGLLAIEDGLGSRVLVPVSASGAAAAAPPAGAGGRPGTRGAVGGAYTGLWVGSAVVSQVSEVRRSVKRYCPCPEAAGASADRICPAGFDGSLGELCENGSLLDFGEEDPPALASWPYYCPNGPDQIVDNPLGFDLEGSESVAFSPFSVTTILDATDPDAPEAEEAVTGSQNGRKDFTGAPSACGSPKADPGPLAGDIGARQYDAYTFVNPSAQAECFAVDLVGGSIVSFAYDSATGVHLGDMGLVATAQYSHYSFLVGAGRAFTVKVLEREPALGLGDEYTLDVRGIVADLPDFPELGPERSIWLHAGGDVVSVEVSVDIQHIYKGDLTVELESPSGTKVTLHNRSGSNEDDIVETYPPAIPAGPGELADFVGEPASGRWRLRINDLLFASNEPIGALRSWGLKLETEAPNPAALETCVLFEQGDDQPQPARHEFELRLLVHCDEAGDAKLLKEVTLMFEEGEDGDEVTAEVPGRYVLVANDERLTDPDFIGSSMRDGSVVGTRVSTVAYDFDGSSKLLSGSLEPGRSLDMSPPSTPLTLEPTDPTNPFHHQYHPDHNVRNESFGAFLGNPESPDGLSSPQRFEEFRITRDISLDFCPLSLTPLEDEEDPCFGFGFDTQSNPEAGVSLLTGTFNEEISGLHNQPIFVRGRFELRRVSTVGTLEE